MKSTFESALAVAQMLVGNLLHARRGQALSRELLLEQAKAAITALQATDVDPELLAAELGKRFDIFVRPASILLDTEEPHEQWVTSTLKQEWRFWRRCEQYLLTRLPEPVVRGIDEETDRILGLLGNPAASGRWDRRGLVVGDVQFGKTSNYSALACKAADAGYKVIVVLAGMHESLRMQTQIRLDEAFLGFKTDQSQALAGAGLYDPSLQAVAATARSQRGDFNKIVAGQLSVPLDIGPPILLVVKKNARMLRNLHSWLERFARSTDAAGQHVIRDAPALVIDDESDNASVDTAEQAFDKDEKPDLLHQPTAINGLIRQILKTFDKRSYVGYTATPFANIFIHRASETTEAAKDLFPKHFIVNLHAPSNYFGPIQAFGSEDDSEEVSTATALVRIIDRDPNDQKELDEWLPTPHKQHHEPVLQSEDSFPHSLRHAILSFIIACAVRKLRGQATEHNSMLVHVTRYTKVQARIFDQINEALIRIRRRLRFGDQSAVQTVRGELHKLWVEDFVPTTERLREAEFADAGELPDWAAVEAILPDVAAGIKVKQINGQAQDVLDYDSHSETGIDVIVVGGDKLSRGLTLYGLTVSYFTRQTDMYDTLLQMGRWFGYRSGYLDLCRLYTTGALNSAFEHIAFASDELRREFDYMQTISKTPEDFGLKVLAHPVLKVTAANKRRHARDIVLYASYAGIVSETKSFSLEPGVLSENRLTLDRFVRALRKNSGDERGPSYLEGGKRREYAHDWLWQGISFEKVGEFLRNYHTEPSARRASSKLWLKYIEKQIAENGELSVWNIALLDGDMEPSCSIGGLDVRPTRRQRDKDIAGQLEGYHTKRLVTTRDVGIDMPLEPWEWALGYDKKVSPDRNSNEPTSSALCLARKQFSIAPLLMLYLPQPNDYPQNFEPVVGAAIAFPGSEKAASIPIRYTVNSVYDDELDEVA